MDVDTYGALEDWYGLSINSSSNETIYVDRKRGRLHIRLSPLGPRHVGMSQRGAQTMAQQGLGAEDILAFYYPGTQLRTLSLTDTTGSGLHDGARRKRRWGRLCASAARRSTPPPRPARRAWAHVPAGALVDVYEAGPEWSRVGYGLLRGWAQTALFALPGGRLPPRRRPPRPPRRRTRPGGGPW